MPQWWMSVLPLLITMITRGIVPIELDSNILDAIAGETFLVKTWAENHQLKSITVLTGSNTIRLTAFFVKTNLIISKDPKGVILLKYNNATKEMSLILENFSKEDEAKYNVEEIADDTRPNPFERKGGKWNFFLNVIEPSEIMKGNVGGRSLMKFRKSPISGNLYYYDQMVAYLMESECRVLTHSHLHGRLRCSIDNNRRRIIIENVTQRDTGLYKVANNKNNDIEQSYLNVTDQTTNATIGGNVTIDWFYNQQGINRTLWIIHSNNGIMMILSPNNEPQIVPAFQERLLYSGEMSKYYMSLTLLNIGQKDSGVYKIETLHGTTISGCKHLLVEGDNDAYGDPPTATERTESTPALPRLTTTDSSSTRGPSLIHSADILDTEEYTASPSLIVKLTSPGNPTITYDDTNTARKHPHTLQAPDIFIDVKYVVIGAMGLIMLMIGCLIWIQRRNTYSLKEVQRRVLATSSSKIYDTPSVIRTQLPTSIVDEEGIGRLIHSTPVRNAQSVIKYLVVPDNSLSFDAQSNFTNSVQILEDDKHAIIRKTSVTSKESNKMSTEKLSDACANDFRGLPEDYPAVCIFGSSAGNAVVGLSQHDQFPHDLYAKVKKGPRSASTSTNNNQLAFISVTGGECTDGYKMVNFTRGNDPRNTFQDVETVSESINPVHDSLQEQDNTRTSFVHNANEDDGYETCGNIQHMTNMAHVKVSEDECALAVKDQEPKKCTIPHGAMHSDYADVDL